MRKRKLHAGAIAGVYWQYVSDCYKDTIEEKYCLNMLTEDIVAGKV